MKNNKDEREKMIKQVTSVIALTTLLGSPMVASADWMMDLRYNHAQMSDTSGSDPNTDLLDFTTSFNGSGIEGESSFGIAIGKSFGDLSVSLGDMSVSLGDMSVSLAYESMSGETDYSGSTLADGLLINAGKEAFDMENFMLELGLNNSLTESVALVGLVGLGVTSFDNEANRFSGLVTDGKVPGPARENLGKVGSSSDDISMRIGGGVESKFAETVSLLIILQYTNYGSYESALQARDGTIRKSDVDVEATELSMRLRFMF